MLRHERALAETAQAELKLTSLTASKDDKIAQKRGELKILQSVADGNEKMIADMMPGLKQFEQLVTLTVKQSAEEDMLGFEIGEKQDCLKMTTKKIEETMQEIEMLEHTRDDNEGTISVLEEVAQYGEEMEERCYELIHVCRVAAVQLLVKAEVAQQHKSLTKAVLLWYSHNARAMEQRTREANEASIVQLEDLIEDSLNSMLSDAAK